MTDQIGKSLAGIALFRDLGPAEVAAIEKRCRWHRYGAEEPVLDRLSDNRDVFLVVEGLVRIVNYSLSGREIAYATVGPSGYFGELAAIDGGPRSASVLAVEDCLLASITPQAFKAIMVDHPNIATEVLQRLARIIRTCDDRILDLSTLRAVQRVYVELLRLATPSPLDPNSFLIRPMPTHKDIAAWAGTTRETVARVMSHLAEGKIVERKDRALYIRDKARLEHLAEVLDPERESEHTR